MDFATQVWPIFQSRCFHCHGDTKAKGDLRMDVHEHLLAGGHSGNEIIGSVDDSELLRRITSVEDDYRMPKNEVPLSKDQVELIESWIAQGAPWTPPSLFSNFTKGEFPHDLLDEALVYYHRLKYLAALFLAYLIGILFVERRKRHIESVGEDDRDQLGWTNRIAKNSLRSHYMAGAMAFVTVMAVSLFVLERESRLKAESESRTKHRSTVKKSSVARGRIIPRPHHPKHPPRLGGTYYRGNDERSDELFNGGFYRTATFDVFLTDTAGNRLEWEAPVPEGELKIFLRIEKAPNTTRSLFRDDAIEANVLTRQIPGSAVEDTPVHFTTVEPGQVWEASYSIATIDAEAGGRELSGLIYAGPRNPHYGIQYDISISDDLTIDSSSELWMGAIQLTGNVVLLESPKMPLWEWFDFRPIPEITGTNTDDPDLLGITEHQNENSTFAPPEQVESSGTQ